MSAASQRLYATGSSMSFTVRKVAVALAAATALTVGTGVTSAQAATSGPCWGNTSQTCRPYMSTAWTPWLSTWSQGSQYWSIPSGTRVDMRCWTTGATRLGTAKWFYVTSTAYPFTSGYVPANAVAAQIVVGHC
ncbi:MAG TPA: hypothetical protein VFP72_05280 [Kineosporiaceae bacterium]|nr:hypothetical protein [Kineosporiaceae bacterium]